MKLSKTDFIQYLNCPKSLWLLKHKPEIYPYGELSDYNKKIIAEGYEVEAYVKLFLNAKLDAKCYSYQVNFQTKEGLFANADVIYSNNDKTINIYEVKSSTDIKSNQIKDATFQKIVAEGSGYKVKNIFIIHLNQNYISDGVIDPEQLLTFVDITSRVTESGIEIRQQIDEALLLLDQEYINQKFCSCLEKTKGNHCDTFNYFNPNLPKLSIYNLPRISKSKISNFIEDGRFDLDEIGVDEVTDNQKLVLNSAHLKKPIINQAILSNWFSKIEYPVYFLDYETYHSAVPVIAGASPQTQIPFQYSLHVKSSSSNNCTSHVEYLAEQAMMPISMIEHMEKNIGDVGSIISWHASFENTQNKNMSKLYPEKEKFLNGLIERTLDLEDLFKKGYVDSKFKGSTSIKNILPVLMPELNYDELAISNGTDAMQAWKKLIYMPEGNDKDRLREEMLKYCKLDTYAMVKIFEIIEDKYE
jgi:hypothetical protein